MPENPYQPPAGEPPLPKADWLDRWLILLITVAVLDVALLVYLPGLGIPVIILAAVPLTRVYLTVRRARAQGAPFRVSDAVLLMFMTAMVLVGSIAAAAIAFGCVCTAIALGGMALGLDKYVGPSGDYLTYIAFGTGGLVGLVVLVALFVRLWPKSRTLLVSPSATPGQGFDPPDASM